MLTNDHVLRKFGKKNIEKHTISMLKLIDAINKCNTCI